MKRLSVIALLSVLMACSSNPDGYTIHGTVSGEVADGTAVYLKKANEQNQPVDVDTAQVENGEFSFIGEIGQAELHYIFIDETQGNIPIVLEEGTIDVTTHKDSLAYAEIEGTPQNDYFADFLESSRALSRRAISMNEDMREATLQRDTAIMYSLREEYFELQEEAKEFELNYARDNPNALISALIIDKVMTTGALTAEEIKELFDSLSDEIKATSVGQKIKSRIEKGANSSIGSKAPNFSAPTPSGGELALHDVLGKVTIVDFWAAWCKPCRAENPNLVRIYNKYKDQGLNILSVSLDRRAEDWKQAIEDDGLEWNHVSNVQYFDEIAELYNVNAIPATFILDEKGVIVAKNLRGQELEETIGGLLQ
jgi:thiol-disulfide isomerase/thioredoxin